ncbi:hypothetical protein PMIN02_005766 [Paraphaeosphaeria minitans]
MCRGPASCQHAALEVRATAFARPGGPAVCDAMRCDATEGLSPSTASASLTVSMGTEARRALHTEAHRTEAHHTTPKHTTLKHTTLKHTTLKHTTLKHTTPEHTD